MRAFRGITLVEVLASILILGIGLIGAAGCLSAAVLANQKANRIALATELAENTIEDMRSDKDIVSSETVIDDSFVKNAQALLPHGKLIIDVSDYHAKMKLKRVRVTVSWQGQQARIDSVSLDTIISTRMRHAGG